MDDLTRFKELVKEAVTRKFPNEAHLVEEMPGDAWGMYFRLIKSYHSGNDSVAGWDATIRCRMAETGVELRTLYILAYIRGDIDLGRL